MDAPGATTANGGAEKGAADHDTPARSRSPSDTNPDEHDRRHQDSDEESEGSEEATDDEDSDDDDEEPRLKYAYLTKHLGSVYRNGDATSTFLVAGDKMVRVYPRDYGTNTLTRMYRLLEHTTESL